MLLDVPVDLWSRSFEQSFALVQARQQGLSSQEAAQRLADSGRNTAIEQTRRKLIAKIGKRLLEPLIAILIVAALASGATGDCASFGIILAILSISVALDVTQEHRAETAAEALKHSVAVRSQVRRDGSPVSLPVEEIVPGGIVMLRAGDLVPAGGIVLDSQAAHTNEALLTGEPFPVEKRPGPSDAATPAEAFNALFGVSIPRAGILRVSTMWRRTGPMLACRWTEPRMSPAPPPT